MFGLPLPKKGEDCPVTLSFKLESFAREQLCDKSSLINEFLKKEYVEHIINRHKRNIRDYSSHIWAILFFEFWLREWYKSNL